MATSQLMQKAKFIGKFMSYFDFIICLFIFIDLFFYGEKKKDIELCRICVRQPVPPQV